MRRSRSVEADVRLADCRTKHEYAPGTERVLDATRTKRRAVAAATVGTDNDRSLAVRRAAGTAGRRIDGLQEWEGIGVVVVVTVAMDVEVHVWRSRRARVPDRADHLSCGHPNTLDDPARDVIEMPVVVTPAATVLDRDSVA